MNWQYTDQVRAVVSRTLPDGTTESMLASALPEDIEPADPPSPSQASLILQARAEALPIRQLALDVLSGLGFDCLVAGDAAGAAMCSGARDRVKAMGEEVDLAACPDYAGMRQAYKAAWAAISATFDTRPELKLQFNKAVK